MQLHPTTQQIIRLRQGLGAIELSEEIPPLDADVLTVGYPMGGENICVTRGVVSRIDLMDYTFSPIGGERQLVIQAAVCVGSGFVQSVIHCELV
ncbi:DEGP13 [Symbiodinium microadriaticum]|nr:DEGP13 [Symbiodinium microadriaticum]